MVQVVDFDRKAELDGQKIYLVDYKAKAII